MADNEFTLEECEMFFKNIIRNSTRRNESNKLRTSRSKIRSKKLACNTTNTSKSDADHRTNKDDADENNINENDRAKAVENN